jgi:site-specific recombinase XerD
MSSKTKPITKPITDADTSTLPTPLSPTVVLTTYLEWLTKQPLADNTRRTYRVRVTQYCAFLAARPTHYGDPLREQHARDYAVRDYKAHLQTARHAKPSSVNLTLAALDHFYRFLSLGPPRVDREDLPQQAPRALEPDEQVHFLRALERSTSVRDRAIALLLFYTGLRIGEAASLNLDDAPVSARKGKVIVRLGKGQTYREVPLNAEVRNALTAWVLERSKRFPQYSTEGSTNDNAEAGQGALFLNRAGGRLSSRAIDSLLRRLATEAGLSLSAHTLRHTCLTNLVRQGTDLVLVAELAGHKRLETTRRYSLPSASEREAAMERLKVNY